MWLLREQGRGSEGAEGAAVADQLQLSWESGQSSALSQGPCKGPRPLPGAESPWGFLSTIWPSPKAPPLGIWQEDRWGIKVAEGEEPLLMPLIY